MPHLLPDAGPQRVIAATNFACSRGETLAVASGTEGRGSMC